MDYPFLSSRIFFLFFLLFLFFFFPYFLNFVLCYVIGEITLGCKNKIKKTKRKQTKQKKKRKQNYMAAWLQMARSASNVYCSTCPLATKSWFIFFPIILLSLQSLSLLCFYFCLSQSVLMLHSFISFAILVYIYQFPCIFLTRFSF